MKMKELKEKLGSEGFEISERMIQYYIQLGILPSAEYPHVNQAVYSKVHLNRLMRICQMKKNGLSFNDIKNLLLKEKEELRQEADKRNISFEKMCEICGHYEKEEADYLIEEIRTKEYNLTKKEMIEKLSCDKLIFELAVDTGALEDKNEYNENDLFVLLCVKNVMENSGTDEKSANIIEKISDISKINNLVSQLVHLYTQDVDRMWIYEYLTHSIIKRKLPPNDTKKSDR